MEDDKCEICEKITNSVSGNPDMWPVFLPHKNGAGKKLAYHVGCLAKLIGKILEEK